MYIERKIQNDKFVYKGAKNEDIDRIKSLRIPPKWSNVNISRNKNDKIQATGFDDKNRKQYIYNKNWIEKSKTDKFKRMNTFDYSKYNRVIKHYMNKNNLCRNCVIANVIKIMEDLNIRVGSESYKKENGTYGITTLLKSHLQGDKLIFKGKKGIEHIKIIKNSNSINFIKRVLNIKGPNLFYDNNMKSICSADLNEFLKDKVQSNITCKDIRTYRANCIFLNYMKNLKLGSTPNERKKNVIYGIDHTANELGNTRKICKDSYLCPNNIKKFL